MPNGIGQPNVSLPTGRIGYGYDPVAGSTYPFYANSAGNSLKKTIQTELYAAASVAASTNVLAATVDVSNISQATFLIFHGRQVATAFGTNGTEYRIEGSAASSGNDSWLPLVSVLAGSTAAQTLASSGSHAAGAGTITILSGTAANTGGISVFTTGTIEWIRTVSASGTASFTILDPLTYAHAAGTISDQAELFPLTLNLESVTRVRAVINNLASGTTQAIYSRIAMVTAQ